MVRTAIESCRAHINNILNVLLRNKQLQLLTEEEFIEKSNSLFVSLKVLGYIEKIPTTINAELIFGLNYLYFDGIYTFDTWLTQNWLECDTFDSKRFDDYYYHGVDSYIMVKNDDVEPNVNVESSKYTLEEARRLFGRK